MFLGLIGALHKWSGLPALSGQAGLRKSWVLANMFARPDIQATGVVLRAETVLYCDGAIAWTEGEPTMPQSIVQPLRRWDPERIGSYAIIGRLGAGAMGQVFLARSTAGRLVAVKTIRVELAEEAGFRARF